MLFLLFQLGRDRYALGVQRVVEVVPLLELKAVPQAPRGLEGIFNYRGQPVPAVDLSQLTFGQPAAARLSTRIIIVKLADETGGQHLVGLIAENATEMLRKEAHEFLPSGLEAGQTPFLGPVFMDSQGPIQWVREEVLLSGPLRERLFHKPQSLLYIPGPAMCQAGGGPLQP
jgi:chemotaxis-related protein WspB